MDRSTIDGRPRVERTVQLVLAADQGMPLVEDVDDAPIRGVNDVEAPLQAMLGGIGRRHALNLLLWFDAKHTLPMRKRPVGMDRLTAILLSHHGIDPLVMHVFGVVAGGIVVASGQVRIHYPPTDAGKMVVALAPDVIWRPGGTMDVGQVPLTVANMVRGEPLSRILSHPVLDPLGLVIRRIRVAKSGRAHLTLGPGHNPARSELARYITRNPEPATIEDLIAAGPGGCRG